MKKIETISKLKEIGNQLKKRKKTVGLITGVFDILHYQHVEFLSFAKKRADVLIVGIECDENVKMFKEEDRPLFDFKKRAFVLSSLSCVDFIFKIPKVKNKESIADFYKAIIKKINPDVLFSAVLTDNSWKEKKNRAEELNIKFVAYNKKPEVSSSKIVSILLKK